MPTFSPASPDVKALIRDRIHSGHYPDLVEAEVTVSAWFAYGKDGEPALKLHGEPAAATIKINSTKDRLEGKADTSMNIDGWAWKNQWTDENKVALIDHEIEHIIVRRTKKTKKDPGNRIMSDDIGRPKLKLRHHDLVLGGFSKIAKRHGVASFEVQIARDIKNAYGQILFAWDDDNAPADDMPDMAGVFAGHGDDDDMDDRDDE